MRGKKVLFLFLGLGMPILILVFLKMFGRNEFAVPLPPLNPPADCRITDTTNYQVPDSALKAIFNTPFNLLVVNFGGESKKLSRVVEGFSPDVMKVEPANDPSLELVKRCAFFVHGAENVVLIDQDRRIRGYYDGSDRDELDRLEAEIKIILKRY